MGQDKALMAEKFGEVIGYFAYGHPFLHGNGRTIMVVRTELAQRAGISSIDWAATDRADYPNALTRELNHPGKGPLDTYLRPYVGLAIGRKRLAGHVVRVSGIGGNPKDLGDANEALGTYSDPALQERYRQQVQQRVDVAGAGRDATQQPSGRPPRGRGGRGR
jgi:cell filamentation protein